LYRRRTSWADNFVLKSCCFDVFKATVKDLETLEKLLPAEFEKLCRSP
jgi:hypothetical protein